MKTKRGFTMVELVIVVAIFGMVFLVVSSTFFNSLKGAMKAEALKEVRQNGDVAMAALTRAIRDADFVEVKNYNVPNTNNTCDDTDPIQHQVIVNSIVNNLSQRTRYWIAANQLVSDIDSPWTAHNITDTNNVEVVPNSLLIDCTQYRNRGQVTISLTLRYVPFGNTANLRSEENVQIPFVTTVTNRNFK